MADIAVKEIRSLEEYVSYLGGIQRAVKGSLWYRGCGKSTYKLKPSLYRHTLTKTIGGFLALEATLLARFKQRSIPFHSNAPTDPWHWLFLMQHYGVPTRFLDWSESPLMALFFAVTSASHVLGRSGQPVFASDAAVWLLDPARWNERSVDLSGFRGAVLTTDHPMAGSYQPVGDERTMKPYPIALYGAHNSQRIVAQRGVFVCFGKDLRSMEQMYRSVNFPRHCLRKVIVRRGRLPAIYRSLLNHGLTDSVAFPDLDGLAREIKREHSFEV